MIFFIFSGKKALWKHNTYGLTPSIASAHCLLVVMMFQLFHRTVWFSSAYGLQIKNACSDTGAVTC